MKNGRIIIALIMSMLMSGFAYADAAKMVFSADFNEGYNAEGWVVSDANSDGLTWSIDPQLNGYIYNGISSSQPAEDWLFTPSVEVEAGNSIVEHTMESFNTVLANMESFAGMASGAAEASKEQAEMLRQIEIGIEQITEVVENNSAAAEETSAVSEELSAQATNLEQMISHFVLVEEE